MKLSPLQLSRYVITSVGCSADPQFNPEKEMGNALERLSVNVRANKLEPQPGVTGHSWSVEMGIEQQRLEGLNFPYTFHISILGTFEFQDGIADAEKERRFIEVNGSSILYAMAREQMRALTSAGPWGTVILPTMSFYEKKETAKKEDASGTQSQ